MLLPRRKFLAGLGSLLAAPAIVKASSLMPVKVMEPMIRPWKSIYCVLYNKDGSILGYSDRVDTKVDGDAYYGGQFADLDARFEGYNMSSPIIPAGAKGAIMKDGMSLYDFTVEVMGRPQEIILQTGDSLIMRTRVALS